MGERSLRLATGWAAVHQKIHQHPESPDVDKLGVPVRDALLHAAWQLASIALLQRCLCPISSGATCAAA